MPPELWAIPCGGCDPDRRWLRIASGIESIAQAVAEQVQGQDQAEDRQPGQIAIHGACWMKFLAVLSMLPQLGSGGCWPRPRNDRLASAIIAAAVARVAW